MIWFACKQCGKRHGRAESLVGTLVFCECGQGNRVPWASTVPEPEAPPEPPPPASAPARPRPRPAPEEDEDDLPPPVAQPLRRTPEVRRPNPKYTLTPD